MMLDRTIFGIEEMDGERYIHFYAYGYYADDGSDTPYRLLEYTYFYAKEADVLAYKADVVSFGDCHSTKYEDGFSGFENKFGSDVKQYITDCTEEELENMLSHYDNGNAPIEIDEADIPASSPGIYILK